MDTLGRVAVTIALLLALPISSRSAFAQTVSGFFDMQATTRQNDPGIVSMGDFELDLASDLGRNTQLAVAIVANDEGKSLSVGFVDVHFLGGLIAPRGRLPVEKGFHLQMGRFDVPFGQDWQYFAAKDRTELSAPLTTEEIMDGGYNDVGVRILGNTRGFNYSAFALRGEGPGRLYGARVGITPFDNPYRFKPTHTFETGISLLQDIDGNGRTRANFFAIDSEAEIGRCRVRAEYLRKDLRRSEEQEPVVRSGWHVTAAFDAGEWAGVPVTPYARYDTARTERFTAGFNTTLARFLVVKVEYQRTLAAPVDASWFAQAVVVF